MALEPVDGGGGGNTGKYRDITQRPDILIVGSQVLDAVTVTATDAVYGISFSFTRSTKSWEGGAVPAAASFYAGNIQALAGYQHVRGMVYTQGVNASGGLVDQMEITVGTDDDEQAVTFVWPLETLDGQGVYAKVDQMFTQLMQNAQPN